MEKGSGGWKNLQRVSLVEETRECQREKSEEEIGTEKETGTGTGSVVIGIKIERGTEKGGGTETGTEIASIGETGEIASVKRIDTALCFPLWVRTKV